MDKNTPKLCTKCGQPLTDSTIKLVKGKPLARCRDCLREYQRQYVLANREKRKKYMQQYTTINRDKIKEYHKGHYLQNKDKINQQHREYHHQTKDKRSQHKKDYRTQNKDKLNQQKREYYANNKTQVQHRHHNWRNKNRDKIRLYDYKRRAREMQAIGHVSEKDWAFIKALYGHRCLWCLRQEPEIKLTMDHVIPLSKGGTHTPQNIQPLCKSCNSKKQTKTIDFRYPHLVMSWMVCCSPSLLQEYVLEPNV